jgi:hypothetical protein
MTKKETKALKKKEQVHFLNLTLTILIINYMSKNKSYDTSIKAGSEVIAVNGINP